MREVHRVFDEDASAAPSRGDRSRASAMHVGVPALLLVLSIFLAPLLSAGSPLIDAESGVTVRDVTLHLPASYIVLSPVSPLLDNLSLLTVRQHVALLLTILVGTLLVLRPWRDRMRPFRPSRATAASGRRGRAAVRTLGAVCAAIASMALLYASALLVDRPMARLAVTREHAADIVTVDFHSHTQASHDGRHGFSAAANREWHRAAGFDVAYITDHGRSDSAIAAMGRNPRLSGEGTVVLPGVEVVLGGEHVVGLGLGARRSIRRATEPAASDPSETTRWPVVVHTIPERLMNVATPGVDGTGGAAAIELTDACPRGLDQARRDRGRILRIADSLDLAVVSASNDHGWSRTAAAWSLLHIAGWRAISPAALDSAIQRTITRDRRHAVRVVLRRPVPGATSVVGLVLTGPALVWITLGTQPLPGRVASALWVVLLVGVRMSYARRRPATAALASASRDRGPSVRPCAPVA